LDERTNNLARNFNFRREWQVNFPNLNERLEEFGSTYLQHVVVGLFGAFIFVSVILWQHSGKTNVGNTGRLGAVASAAAKAKEKDAAVEKKAS
jgi:branched-subunit amino acid transport protein